MGKKTKGFFFELVISTIIVNVERAKANTEYDIIDVDVNADPPTLGQACQIIGVLKLSLVGNYN